MQAVARSHLIDNNHEENAEKSIIEGSKDAITTDTSLAVRNLALSSIRYPLLF
jgi:hypothetical protein